MAKELSPHFKGERTRLLYEPLFKALTIAKLTESEADKAAKEIINALVKLDAKSTDKVKATTLYFMSPLEITTLATAYSESKDVKKAIKAIDTKNRGCRGDSLCEGVFPARAGMNRPGLYGWISCPRVPRTRGDEP